MTDRIDTAQERRRLAGNEAVLHRIPSYLDALDAKDAESAAALDEIDRLRADRDRLIAAFRINSLIWKPGIGHDEIDAHIASILSTKQDAP